MIARHSLVTASLFAVCACGSGAEAHLSASVRIDSLLADDVTSMSVFVLGPKRSDGIFLDCDSLMFRTILPTDSKVEILARRDITFTAPGVVQSHTVTVYLTVYTSGTTQPPFGEFSTPLDGAAVGGSIAVTGWVLDDIGVKNVKIYNGEQYIGDAVFVEGARPDVETAYPSYPDNHRAGWGYMMLTNFLPNGEC